MGPMAKFEGKKIVIARAVQERDNELGARLLGPLSIAEVEAMSDEEIAAAIGITLDESWTDEDRFYMREGAKCYSNGY